MPKMAYFEQEPPAEEPAPMEYQTVQPTDEDGEPIFDAPAHVEKPTKKPAKAEEK